MNRRRFALALVLSALTAGSFAQSKAAGPVTVSDAKQFVRAIAPGRTIVLKKGDYLLSTAYGVKNEYATWKDGDDGKQLSLSNLENVTIRGADGARIVSDSSLSSILGVYDSKNVTFDNIRFVRQSKPGSEVGAGSLSAESVHGLSLDRCSFEGSTAMAIDLWDCEGVSVKRTSVSGATAGVLSASYTHDLNVSSSRISGCAGYPLIYLEESDGALFSETRFEKCSGGNFIEIYAESGSVESVRFEGCAFQGNRVDYFAGSQIIPTAESCQFADNSFGEDWETASVAPASDKMQSDQGSSAEEGPQWYDHSSGLSFSYPTTWEMKEYKAESRVGVFAPDGKSLAFFLTAYEIPADVDPAAQTKKLFADSASALVKLLKDEAGLVLDLKADGEPYTDNDLSSMDYLGRATKGDGGKAEARVRFVVTGDSVDAMVALAADSSMLEAGGEIDGIFTSIEASDQGD